MNYKLCNKCNIEKPLNDFSDHPKGISGKQTHCKSCVAENHRKYNQRKPCISCGKAKGGDISKGAKLCQSCSKVCFDCKINPRRNQHRRCKECESKRDKLRNSTPERKHQQRITAVCTKYKVPRKEAERLTSISNCTCCDKFLPEFKNRHVDHCHKTGKVRNVLCFNCNAALGHVNDSKDILSKLINYLDTHTNQPTVDE